MATTTNYGWDTPDDTDLVKDGASAIRTLGSSIDTTTKALNPSTTLGDIEYRSATANTNTRLGIGSTGQVLTVTGGVPAWETISAGGITLISETVASAVSSINLTSIPQTYKKLRLEWNGIRHSGNGSSFTLRVNNNSGTIYNEQLITSAPSSAFNNTGSQDTGVGAGGGGNYLFGNSTYNATNLFDATGFFEIDNYTSTTKLKTTNGSWGYFNNGVSYWLIARSNGFLDTTSAITELNIYRVGGSQTFSNQANTSIRLYGIS